jgi:hypothetical protein
VIFTATAAYPYVDQDQATAALHSKLRQIVVGANSPSHGAFRQFHKRPRCRLGGGTRYDDMRGRRAGLTRRHMVGRYRTRLAHRGHSSSFRSSPLGPLVPCRSSVWAALLGGTVDAEDDWHMVLVDGSARVGVQLALDDVPPDCPHGSPQQIHLDLWVDDIDTAHEEVMSLGAKLLQAAADSDAPDNFKVYADPAGHPSCLCWVKK